MTFVDDHDIGIGPKFGPLERLSAANLNWRIRLPQGMRRLNHADVENVVATERSACLVDQSEIWNHERDALAARQCMLDDLGSDARFSRTCRQLQHDAPLARADLRVGLVNGVDLVVAKRALFYVLIEGLICGIGFVIAAKQKRSPGPVIANAMRGPHRIGAFHLSADRVAQLHAPAAWRQLPDDLGTTSLECVRRKAHKTNQISVDSGIPFVSLRQRGLVLLVTLKAMSYRRFSRSRVLYAEIIRNTRH
jgi:hypothetical protein